MRDIGQRAGDVAIELAGHTSVGTTLRYLGRLAESRVFLEAACALSDSGPHRFVERGFQEDPGVIAWGWLSWDLWAAGFPDRSRETAQGGIDRAAVTGHPYTLSFTQVWAAIAALYRRDWREARRLGSQAARLADEQGIPLLAAVGTLAETAGAVMGDEEHAGVDRFVQAMGDAGATGNRASSAAMLGVFAELLLAVNRVEEANQHVDAGLQVAESIHEGFYLPELHRLKGESRLG